jgi:hypothetical protein
MMRLEVWVWLRLIITVVDDYHLCLVSRQRSFLGAWIHRVVSVVAILYHRLRQVGTAFLVRGVLHRSSRLNRRVEVTIVCSALTPCPLHRPNPHSHSTLTIPVGPYLPLPNPPSTISASRSSDTKARRWRSGGAGRFATFPVKLRQDSLPTSVTSTGTSTHQHPQHHPPPSFDFLHSPLTPPSMNLKTRNDLGADSFSLSIAEALEGKKEALGEESAWKRRLSGSADLPLLLLGLRLLRHLSFINRYLPPSPVPVLVRTRSRARLQPTTRLSRRRIPGLHRPKKILDTFQPL